MDQKAAKEQERLRKKLEKEAEKERRDQARQDEKRRRLEKKEEEDFEKRKRQLVQEAHRYAKPGECLKLMTVMVDPGVLRLSCGSAVLEVLNAANVRYDIQPQVMGHMISFWREVTEVLETEPRKLETKKREVMEIEVLVILPLLEFLGFVHNQHSGGGATLSGWYRERKEQIENKNLTVIVEGLEKYFSECGNKQQRGYKKAVQGRPAESRGKGQTEYSVTRLQVEESLLELQLVGGGGSVRLVDKDADVGQTVLMFTKAVAETPYKRDRLDTGLTVYSSNTGSVKVGRDGAGLQQLWRLQLQQFHSVSAEVANAIMAVYPSPCDLHKAYEQCENARQAEKLLQDIVVRRGVGPLANSRRIGQELSRKMCYMFTSTDGGLVIK